MVVTLQTVTSERSATMMAMTRIPESNRPSDCLLLAFELGQRAWKLGFAGGVGQRPRLCQIPAGAVRALENQIARAKLRFGLPAEARFVGGYEAAGDGLWLHRNGLDDRLIDDAAEL